MDQCEESGSYLRPTPSLTLQPCVFHRPDRANGETFLRKLSMGNKCERVFEDRLDDICCCSAHLFDFGFYFLVAGRVGVSAE